jgi:hypothetical protein
VLFFVIVADSASVRYFLGGVLGVPYSEYPHFDLLAERESHWIAGSVVGQQHSQLALPALRITAPELLRRMLAMT